MKKYLINCSLTFICLFGCSVLYADNERLSKNNVQIEYSNVDQKNKEHTSDNSESLNKNKKIKDKTDNLETKEPISGDISFDFYNTDLKTFGQFVAKLDKKTLIGEDLLKGNVNMHTFKKMTLLQLKSFFNALLSTKGLDSFETDIYIQIIPMSNSFVKVYELKYLKASDLAKSLSAMYRMSFRVGNTPENIQITSVDDSNAIMVLAPKVQQLEIEKSIKDLDLRTSQVFMNIKIVEVTKETVFGFSAEGGYSNNRNAISTTVPAPKVFSDNTSAASQYAYSNKNVNINLSATEKITKIKLLSQPKILALNNKKSILKFGEKYSYVSSLTTLQSGSQPVGTPATVDIGIDMEITPRINIDKNVILILSLTLNDVQGQFAYKSDGSENNIPIVGHRILKNTSSVKSGQTLVIGGLLKNQKTTLKSNPPVFGDLPYIGWLFSKISEQTEQVELMVFITPSVIDNYKDSVSVLKSEINKLKNYDPLNKEAISQMLTGKKDKTDSVFNIFDYFSDKNYRKEQEFIPQPFDDQVISKQ